MGQFHLLPEQYLDLIRRELPDYDELQDAVATSARLRSGRPVTRVLELGVGTGETTLRVLGHHPGTRVVGIDASAEMLDQARIRLPAEQVRLAVQRLEDPLPDGPFDVVVSALAVHHLDPAEKAHLFRRVALTLGSDGRFVLADVIVPEDRADAVTALDPAHDHPDTLASQLGWLRDADLDPEVVWRHHDLVVVSADRRA